MHKLSGVGLSFLMTGCLSTLMGTKDSRSDDYRVPEPGSGWTVIDPGEADTAFRNDKDQSILNISSVCGEGRFQTLEALSADILKQLPQPEIVQPAQSKLIGGHPGLVTEARGTVDGKPLSVRIAVVRTPTCLFDFILAGAALDESSRIAFDRSLQGFREKTTP